MPTTSARLGFQKPSLSDRADIAASLASMEAVLDSAVTFDHGPLSSMPLVDLSHPGIPGRRYFAEDTQEEYLDIGTQWLSTGSKGVTSSGQSIIAGSDSRSAATFAALATPDQTTVILPANGVIRVLFSALWKESVAGASLAAIFIGGNQLKIAAEAGLEDPYVETPVRGYLEQQASSITNGQSDRWRPVSSFAGGLAMIEEHGVTYDWTFSGGEPASGVAQGFNVDGQGPGYLGSSGGNGGDNAAFEVGRNPNYTGANALRGYLRRLRNTHVGGECVIDGLAAGTYTISIRYAALAGTLSVQKRRLRVKAEKY